MPENLTATITVKKSTRDRFKRLCLKIETYDKFLNRLLDVLEDSGNWLTEEQLAEAEVH